MNIDEARRRLAAEASDWSYLAEAIGTVLDALDAAELAAKTARLDAAEAREWAERHVDRANARAAAAAAGQRAYGEVLLALANNGPRPADPGWGPLARALHAASVGGGAGETSDDAIARAMDAADDELAKEAP